MEWIGIADIRNANVKNLSYGRQKMTELGRALMTNPKLLLLDEPAAGLIPAERKEFVDIILRLFDAGIDIFLIEHNMDVIKCADNIIDLGPEGGSEGGYLVFEGTPEELITCETSYTGKYLAEKLQENK